jgi:uncharacterized protein (DUF2062 family)
MKFRWNDVKAVFYDALRQGLTPRKLATTCSLGIVIGLFPVFGTTTMICFGLAIAFRLNIALIQVVNYLMVPLQVLFIIPFIRMGTVLFDLNPFPYEADQLLELFQSDFLLLLKEAGISLLIGAGVWATLALPLFFLLYFIFFIVFSRWPKRGQREL